MSQRDDKLSPAMRQFRQIKAQHPNDILFFRMGDFYEMFYDDAKTVAAVLNIALTSRKNGVPMAGIPHHAAENYINRMIRAGYRVAVCDQLEDAKKAKGVVKRGVTQVITAGTVSSDALLDAKANNFIAALYHNKVAIGLSWLDTTTGSFWVQEVNEQQWADELARIAPAEVVVPEPDKPDDEERIKQIRQISGATVTHQAPWYFEADAARRELTDHFQTVSLDGFGCEDLGPGIYAAGALLKYVKDTQKADLKHIARLELHSADAFLTLDRATLHSLEIVEPMRGDGATLFSVTDKTLCPMGARTLRRWLLAPLRDVPAIRQRQDAVEELITNRDRRDPLIELLRGISDLERMIARIGTGRCNARDLAGLRDSLPHVAAIHELLNGVASERLAQCAGRLGGLDALHQLLTDTIDESPPLTVREGGMIRPGYSVELDELTAIATEGKGWIARYQAEESERTGIANFKVGYNKVFGYYLEVLHSQSAKVPAEYIRKQTVKNAERYITPELKEYEAKLLTAGDRARDIEYDLFNQVRKAVAKETAAVQRVAGNLGEIDALLSLARVAAERGYLRPTVDHSAVLAITDGRHPVLDVTLVDDPFVPNDVLLDDEKNQIAIVTGPNMAGKSTYIRQVALLTLLGQIGAFLPARSARIGVVDRIFTRVGAADELSRGNSTFMVEMNETANILNNATARSLIVLDEVGRGTSTFDGLSIAWAITEFLFETVRARTLFATHYHELTELALVFPGIKNYTVSVKEWDDEVIFLHKIVPGGTDKSYGIHVAKLAGVPREVVERAKQILTNLESNALDLNDRPKLARGGPAGKKQAVTQMSLFAQIPHEVELLLRDLDLNTLTPLEALNRLKDLKEKLT